MLRATKGQWPALWGRKWRLWLRCVGIDEMRSYRQSLAKSRLKPSPLHSKPPYQSVCSLNITFSLHTHTQRQSFHPRVHFPKGCDSRSCARSKPAAWNSIQTSHGGVAEAKAHGLSSATFPGVEGDSWVGGRAAWTPAGAHELGSVTGGSLTYCTTTPAP